MDDLTTITNAIPQKYHLALLVGAFALSHADRIWKGLSAIGEDVLTACNAIGAAGGFLGLARKVFAGTKSPDKTQPTA